jgi:hypothetical protein
MRMKKMVKEELYLGCFQNRAKLVTGHYELHCTRFEDKTREELIEMFNGMLKYYNHKKIRE